MYLFEIVVIASSQEIDEPGCGELGVQFDLEVRNE